jgi:hypothetical protein
VHYEYLQRYVALYNEMPIEVAHSLQVVGDDADGYLTEVAIRIGLKNIPRLESIHLNFNELAQSVESFIRQILSDKSIKRLKIALPSRLSMRKQCMMGLAQNDHIEELSIQHIPRKLITKDLNQDKRMRELGFGDILYEVSD